MMPPTREGLAFSFALQPRPLNRTSYLPVVDPGTKKRRIFAALPSQTPANSTSVTAVPNTSPVATPSVISSLENVSYDVGGVRVVEDVSLELYDGEIVCLLGPSGSGKSTILRILAGLAQPSSGRALYRGRQFSGTNPAASIVFQTFALYPWLTVLQNVELGLPAAYSVDRELCRARAMSAIDIIGLDGYENAYPRELSGGMRQRVGFARALAVEPEILCMDEPFSALDVLTAENLRSELLRLWQAGDVPTTSVLIVTHGIEEAVSLADRIIILGRDPGHIRTLLPIPMEHPRNRKSELFQSLTDLVYTILSERDYTLSPEDLALVNGELSHLSQPQQTGISNAPEQLKSPTSTPVQPPAHLRLRTGNPRQKEPALPLDGLAISEPLEPVSLDAEDTDPMRDAGRYPQLPAVRIGSVSGLLVFIEEEPSDLYLLGQRLQLDVDDLYPLIDAASILGVIEVDEGDVCINEKGRRFVEATIDDRKNIVRLACLSSPDARLIAHIYRMLREAKTMTLPQELIFDTVLLKHFSPVEARRQMEIAIEWGRFAELFGYESLTGTLFLDTGEDPEVALKTQPQ